MNGQTYSEESETKRFRPAYRELSLEEKGRADEIKSTATKLSLLIHDVKGGTPSREKSLAITKLEESVMWGIKALTACAIFALAIGHAAPAFADQTCAGIGSCNQTDDHSSNAAAAANAGAIATNKVDVDADFYTRMYNKNENDVNVDTRDYNTNINGQHQGQDQGQFQGQGQHQSAKSESEVKGSGNSSISWQDRRDTASAYAGTASIGSDSCGTGVGAGGQGPAFGFSFNFARDDEVCELIKLAREVQGSDPDTAKAIRCQDDRVRKAYAAVGRPCPNFPED